MKQSEVADIIGISCSVYKEIECGKNQSISERVLRKLSELYRVPEKDLMDEYSQFLFDGQAKQIRAYRQSVGMGKKPFARAKGIPIRSLQDWESDRKRISRKSWEKYFRNCI